MKVILMSNEIKLIGIVKAVNKNGILLITKDNDKGQWWNGLGKVIEYITQDLRSNEVEITIINQENHTFSYLRVLKENMSKEVNGSKIGSCEISRDKIIVRQNALSHAASFIDTVATNSNVPNDAKILKEMFFTFAKDCEAWVWRKD